MAINEKEWKHIMRPVIKFRLTRDGKSSNLHTSVRYGPYYLGGIGIFEPIVIQGSGLISFLIKKICKPTPSISLLCANLSTFQL